MTQTDGISATAGVQSLFSSTSPVDGEVLAEYVVTDQATVNETVRVARHAANWWGSIGFAARRKRLTQWKHELVRRIDELVEIVSAETGKPRADAMLEASMAIEHLGWAADNAERVLAQCRVKSGLLMVNQRATVEYRPYGVVGVIGPWNYPVFTPMGSIGYALAAGNAVVFKPSEFTPGVGVWLAGSLAEVIEAPVLQVVTGFAETGHWLCVSNIDKLAFTGSPGTGRKVMAACATNLTPVVIEGGGKDSMIVDADADISAAAEAALWSGMSNAGQTCVGTERVYVHEDVFEEFVTDLVRRAEKLTPGPEPTSDYGPATMASQLLTISRHIDDAVKHGGTVLIGGDIHDRYATPTIIANVEENSAAITEETFGPVLIVNPVASMDEAIDRTNATSYGLAGSVFAKKAGEQIASRIRSGMVAVNSVLSFAVVAALPFGGVGESGFGRIHGDDGLREFAYPKSTTVQKFRPALAMTTFERTELSNRLFWGIVSGLHGSRRGRGKTG